jgi:hypothetical protein
MDVIPAKAGSSTAELVIHLALKRWDNVKMDPRLRGDDHRKNQSTFAQQQPRLPPLR